MKNVAAATRKMIGFYHGNRHDIAHFLKVWAMAKTIGELEGLDGHTQEVLELAAVVHDIACPLCREKYGDTNGKHQELESPPLVEAFFADLPVSRADVDRISWLAAHHHTDTNVDGPDHRILLEADFLVNADEGACARPAIETMRERDPPARYDLFGITDAAPARLPGRALPLDPRRFSSNFGADRAFSVLKRIRGGARIPLKKQSGAGQACGGFFVPRWLEISN